MASRPTSTRKSATTTQRRQNLLRSVSLSYGRYLTNGRYRLTPNTLALVNDNNRVYPGAYFVLRADLRKVLANGESSITSYCHGRLARTNFGVKVSENEIKIGCKTFRGRDEAALREWVTA